MIKTLFSKKEATPEQLEEAAAQDFFDRIAPSTMRFFTDHFHVLGVYEADTAINAKGQ